MHVIGTNFNESVCFVFVKIAFAHSPIHLKVESKLCNELATFCNANLEFAAALFLPKIENKYDSTIIQSINYTTF